MIIKRIVLNNLGPFLGENVINIDYSDEKPIKLIGGKNGAGKTTFFNSLKIGMYGCKAFGYESNNNYYLAKISKLINDKVSIKDNFEASVSILLNIADGLHFGDYLIKRTWKIVKTTLLEEKTFYLNGSLLSEDESSNFENLLIHLIPPSLFEFYFFDGERIAEILTDDGSTTNFKNAFVRMCGLDNLEYLIECFKKNSEKATKNKTLSFKFEKTKLQFEEAKANVAKTKSLIETLENQINDNNLMISKLKVDYAKIGGVSPSEWKEINSSLINEENYRERLRKDLKDIGNDYLPFVILQNTLCTLKENLSSINLDDSLGKAIDTLKKLEIKNSLLECFKSNDSYDEAIIILSNVRNTANKNYYPLTNNELVRVLNQIEEKLSFKKEKVFEIERMLRNSLDKTKQLRFQLAGMNMENYNEYSTKCMELAKENAHLLVQKEALSNDMINLKFKFMQVESDYLKIKKEYEEEIKRVSVHDISSRGYLCFSDLSQKLYEKYIVELKENFSKYFNLLINKENLIDGIYVTDSLSVYPYRFISVSNYEILKMYNELGKENLIKKIGEYAYNVYKSNHKKEFLLPIKIKGTLSEGENQVYLMALYLSLVKLSKNHIPFIIDTPFGRIDKEHRTKILKSFFLNLEGEMVILSTDEEINNENISFIKERINGFNLFSNNGNGKTTIIENAYFEGVDL